MSTQAESRKQRTLQSSKYRIFPIFSSVLLLKYNYTSTYRNKWFAESQTAHKEFTNDNYFWQIYSIYYTEVWFRATFVLVFPHHMGKHTQIKRKSCVSQLLHICYFLDICQIIWSHLCIIITLYCKVWCLLLAYQLIQPLYVHINQIEDNYKIFLLLKICVFLFTTALLFYSNFNVPEKPFSKSSLSQC